MKALDELRRQLVHKLEKTRRPFAVIGRVVERLHGFQYIFQIVLSFALSAQHGHDPGCEEVERMGKGELYYWRNGRRISRRDGWSKFLIESVLPTTGVIS